MVSDEFGLGSAQHITVKLRRCCNAHKPHVAIDLVTQFADNALDARLPRCGQCIKIQTSAGASCCAGGDCFEDMAATPDTAIADDVDLAAHGIGDLGYLIEYRNLLNAFWSYDRPCT